MSRDRVLLTQFTHSWRDHSAPATKARYDSGAAPLE